jgi:hypothetical protein
MFNWIVSILFKITFPIQRPDLEKGISCPVLIILLNWLFMQFKIRELFAQNSTIISEIYNFGIIAV